VRELAKQGLAVVRRVVLDQHSRQRDRVLATRRGADAVMLDDFTRAIERIVAALEKKTAADLEQLKLVMPIAAVRGASAGR